MSAPVLARRHTRLVQALLALSISAVALQAPPASAAPASPVITGPEGTTPPSVEVSWQPVAGANGYEVQIDDDPSFGSPEWTASTVNTVAVPTKRLARGDQHVQVRAKDSSNTWSAWTTQSFTVDHVDGPLLVSPEDGADLPQPAEPPLLVWEPVAGTTTYTVEVDDEPDFVSPTTYTTEASSLLVPDNQAPGVEYYWRVRANLTDGFSTTYSASRAYFVEPITPPVVRSPGNDEDVTDVVLDWDPVAGAKYYELQVDDDYDFSSLETTEVPARIYGTRFSPRTTFGNDQYFWRVRARDLDDNPTEWVQLQPDVHYAFDRVWRDVPQLVHPYDPSGATVFTQNDLYFEWEPVPHASHYEVWVSPDPNFTEPTTTTVQCQVAGTTFTPGELDPMDACMPKSEGTLYYWKVRPMDLPYPGAVQGIFSATQSFVYDDQDAFTITSPAEGALVAVPTLDWAPVVGTETYEVELLDSNGSRVLLEKTHSTSFTPTGAALDPTDGPFRYRLRALDAKNRTTTLASRTFSLGGAPDSSTPLEPVTGPATYDAPNLRWGAMPGADHYRMRIGSTVTGNWFLDTYAPVLGDDLPYPAATDTSVAFLADGTYKWQVTAHNEDGGQIGSGPVSTFTVLPLGPVTGQRLALTGSSLSKPGGACTKTLTDGPGELCDNVPATPVLDWEPAPYVAEYRVHVSRDGDFTTGSLDPEPPRTVNTMWAPTFTYPFPALPDSQAQTPYYWFIQPCKSATQCGPDPRSTINPARHAFRKISPRVELLSPAPEAVVDTTEITFSWRDYYDTNRDTTYAATGEPGYQSGMRYQFQIDDQPTFASPLDTSSVLVDQPTYTAADRLYPEGPLYWRVQPIDAAGNALGWSEVRRVVKTSPRPVLTSPVVDEGSVVPVVNGSVPLRWEAQAFAASYEVQVAANGDRNFSAANLKVTKTSKRAAFTTGMNNVATLQASDQPYVWRVRRIDPSNNAGPWSAIGEFKVVMPQPTQLTPASAAVVGPRGIVLRWTGIADAVKYRVELRKVGTTSTTVTTTPATSWAPTAAMTVGATYEWRVASVDVDNRYADTAPWRTFTVGGPPQATSPAGVDGSAVFGTDLSAVDPAWSVPGVTNTYQWRRNGVDIPDATGPTYTVTVSDVGASITVVVTGSSDEFGTGTSTSAAVVGKAGAGPSVVTGTQIAGSGQVGSVLTSTAPTWDPAETTASFQWLRNGSLISAATGPTYTLVAGDLNASITLRVTGTLPGREPTTSVSNAIVAVQGAAATATSAPTITGTPKVGLTLSSTAPTWNLTVQQTIQWLRNGQPITGQTAASYVVGPDDVGTALSVRYTGKASGRVDGVVESAPVTGLTGDAPTAPAVGAPSGTGRVGTTLTAPVAFWTPGPTQQSRQWLVDGQPVAGANGTTYVVRSTDAGHAVSVLISATMPGRATGSVTSAAVMATAVPTSTPTPTPTPTPAPVTSTVVLKAPSSAPAGTRLLVKIKVSATGISSPTGVVKIFDGKKLIAKLRLKAGAKGVGKLKLPQLAEGRHKLSAVYGGGTGVSPSSSKRVTVRMVR